MHSKYADLCNVACDIFSVIPHGVRVGASFPPDEDVIGWRQSNTTGETLREKVIVRQFAQTNNRILAGADGELNPMSTENNTEMKTEAFERTLHRMTMVHKVLEMWQGNLNVCATQKEYRAKNKQMTATGYMSDTEDIVNGSWTLFHNARADAFTLSERSPLAPPLSVKDLPGGQTLILNICHIRRLNRHPVKRDEDSTPDSISDTEDWLKSNGDLDNRNDTEDDCRVDVESDIVQNNSIEDLDCPDQWDVSAAPNVPGLIWPTQKSKRQAQKVLMTVNAIETRRNKGVNQKLDRMRQCFTSFFMYLELEF